MLKMLLLVAACAGWHHDAAGFYAAEVESQGRKSIDTWFEDTPAGLAGHYVLHEADRDVTGTLEPLGDPDCDVARFRWADLYGSGVAELHFYPAAHCFEGNWGLDEPLPQLIWRSCKRTPVTS